MGASFPDNWKEGERERGREREREREKDGQKFTLLHTAYMYQSTNL
jgi:hypothetical protein